jgi:3-carboxy-cis,cis-muconate cycloisomerase
MADHLADAGDAVLAEQRSMAALAGHEPAAAYSGLVDDLVDEALTRAGRRLPDPEGPS